MMKFKAKKNPSPKPKEPKEKESPKESPKDNPKPKPHKKQEKHPMSREMDANDTPTMSPNLGGSGAGEAGGVEPSPPEGGVATPGQAKAKTPGQTGTEDEPGSEKDEPGGSEDEGDGGEGDGGSEGQPGSSDEGKDQDQQEEKPSPKGSKLIDAMAKAAGYADVPESAAHKNNNPIGQSSESPETSPPTATGMDGNMCTFGSVDDGIRAAEAYTKDLIGGKIPPYTPDMTLTEAAAIYWPQDPEKWAKTVASELSKDDKGKDTGKVKPDVTKLSELPQ